MNKLLAIAVVAVVAGGAINVVVLRRQQELTAKVSGLERRLEARPSAEAAAPERPVADRPIEAPPGSGDVRGDSREPAGGNLSGRPSGASVVPNPAPSSGAMAAAAPLSEAQRDAIAREVDRIMKEKGPGIQIMRPSEQLAFLARELSLSELQKQRIEDLWRLRDAEVRKLMEAAEGFPGPRKFNELQDRYHALVRNELDGTQQLKFDEMKKDGLLPTGNIAIRVEHRDEGDPPK